MNKTQIIKLLEEEIVTTPSGACPSCDKTGHVLGFHMHDADEHYSFYNKGIYDSIEKIKSVK